MENYVVEVETTSTDTSDAALDDIMTTLKHWHPSTGAGMAGFVEVTLTLPAEGLQQALATALAAVSGAAGMTATSASIIPERMRDARAGWTVPEPDLLSVTEVAMALGVTRQRVLQMITKAEIPATRIGNSWAVPRAALAVGETAS